MKLLTFRSRHLSCLLAALTLGGAVSEAAVYEVGPGKEHPGISSVPWEALGAGDTVRIHWRSKAYHEKFIVFGRGTADKPITISGVPGPKGQLPVIDGRDASTRPQLNYWGQERGVMKIGGSNHSRTTPGHIIVENLEIRSARRPFTFSGRRGSEVYKKDAASLNVEIVEHLLLRNLTLHDSSNGLMISPQSKDVRVEGCHIYDNGNPNSISEHNAYSEGIGMVYEGNHFGPLREGCRGNNLKDRSAGLVVRNNWIEGGNRQLDLVEAMGNAAIVASPDYRLTKVYGNVLIELDGPGNNQVVHYGGDMGNTIAYRKGVLQFYNNTVVSYRVKPTALFRVSSEEETVECWNNIVYAKSGKGALSLMVTVGTLKLGKNWLSTGWAKTHEDFKGSVEVLEPSLEGEEPGFASVDQKDYSLKAESPCLNTAATLPKGYILPDSRYVKHQKVEKLPEGAPRSLGAP